jgi:hypothetical protein
MTIPAIAPALKPRSDPDCDVGAVEPDFEAAAAVPAPLAAAREPDSEESSSVYWAPSVTGTAPVETIVVGRPSPSTVVMAKALVAVVKVVSSLAAVGAVAMSLREMEDKLAMFAESADCRDL